MKLYYITRVSLPSKAAQSVQILAMAEAFNQTLGVDFRLISGAGEQIENVKLNFSWKRIAIFYSYPKLRYLIFCAITFISLLMRPKSVLYTRDIMLALVAVLMGKTVGYEAHKMPVGKVAQWIFRYVAKFRCFRLVCISEALSFAYIEKYSLSALTVLTAHDGVFPEQYPTHSEVERIGIRRQLGLPLDKILILHTGSLYKGGTEIFKRVAKHGGDDVIFVHVGGSENECENLRLDFVRSNIQNIMLVPHRNRDMVRKYQQSADVLLYVNLRSSPIYWCTSPLKLFEYMATSVPMVASSVGSVAEVINNENAFCFDPDVDGSVESAFDMCRLDPVVAERRARKARSDVLASYTWQRRAEKIVNFFESGKKFDE